jgi:hypothetical protein
MPRIFEKDCKINVIEYGENCSQVVSFSDIRDIILAPFKNLLRA